MKPLPILGVALVAAVATGAWSAHRASAPPVTTVAAPDAPFAAAFERAPGLALPAAIIAQDEPSYDGRVTFLRIEYGTGGMRDAGFGRGGFGRNRRGWPFE